MRCWVEIFWDVIPYVTLAIVVIGSWWRYRYDKFGWTTRSSQLYESQLLRIASPMFHFGILVVVFGHVIGLLIPQSWTDAVGLSQHAYHIQAVILGTIAGISTLVGIALLIFRRRTTGPVFMATTVNDKVMYVVLVLAIVAGLCATAARVRPRRRGAQLPADRVGVVPLHLDPAAARRPDGRGADVLPDPRADRACTVRVVAVHPAGARLQRADRLPVPALRGVPQPRCCGEGMRWRARHRAAAAGDRYAASSLVSAGLVSAGLVSGRSSAFLTWAVREHATSFGSGTACGTTF